MLTLRVFLTLVSIGVWQGDSYMVGDHACGIVSDRSASTFVQYGAKVDSTGKTFSTHEKAVAFVEHACRFDPCTYGRGPGSKCAVSHIK